MAGRRAWLAYALGAWVLALATACSVDARINPTFGCGQQCSDCVRGFCYDPKPSDAAAIEPPPDAAAPPDATPPDAEAPDAGPIACQSCPDCESTCPAGEMCCAGVCAAECAQTCGNGTVDNGEACDGGALCSKHCTLLFHPSLIHRYSFDGKGTDILDSIGAANGKLVNTKLDGSGDLVLAGGATDQYVNLPNALLRGLGSVTVEVWVTWTGGKKGQRLFDFGYNSSGDDQHTGDGTTYLYVSPQDDAGALAAHINFTPASTDANTDDIVRAGSGLTPNRRHQVAVVFNGYTDAYQLYLDGELVDTKTDVMGMLAQLDDRNMWIGRGNAPVDSLQGKIHEFRMYREALNMVAIQDSYKAGSDPNPD